MPHVDSLVLVARSGRTTAEMAHRAGELLTRADEPVVGVTLVGVPRSSSSRPYYATTRPTLVDLAAFAGAARRQALGERLTSRFGGARLLAV
jgi:Mrp family chromosome partitioning ATPase